MLERVKIFYHPFDDKGQTAGGKLVEVIFFDDGYMAVAVVGQRTFGRIQPAGAQADNNDFQWFFFNHGGLILLKKLQLQEGSIGFTHNKFMMEWHSTLN